MGIHLTCPVLTFLILNLNIPDLTLTWTVGADHKPLISIVNETSLGDIKTPRQQRLKERLMRWNLKVVYIPGKLLGAQMFSQDMKSGSQSDETAPLPLPLRKTASQQWWLTSHPSLPVTWLWQRMEIRTLQSSDVSFMEGFQRQNHRCHLVSNLTGGWGGWGTCWQNTEALFTRETEQLYQNHLGRGRACSRQTLLQILPTPAITAHHVMHSSPVN